VLSRIYCQRGSEQFYGIRFLCESGQLTTCGKIAQRAKNVQLRFKPLLVMLFTPDRDTCNFPHISLKALNEKIDDSLKPYLAAGLKAVF
jgi:hypothetical protein